MSWNALKWLSGVLDSAQIALFPREYVDLYDSASSVHRVHTLGSQYFPGKTSIRTTLHQACRTCARSDRINSPGILRSARLGTTRTSSASARIALFPRKYLSLHHFASSTRQARTLGSHCFPGNTAMCTILHQAHIKCAFA